MYFFFWALVFIPFFALLSADALRNTMPPVMACESSSGDMGDLLSLIYVIGYEKMMEKSMVEKANAREGHCYSVLIARLDNIVVAHAAPCLCHILHSALVGSFDIVAEGEESIRP